MSDKVAQHQTDSWALVIHDARNAVAVGFALSLDISQRAELRWPGVVRRGSREELVPLLERLLHFNVRAELRPSADFPEHVDQPSTDEAICIPISDRDFIPLSRYPLAWRFMDAKYNILPQADLDLIKALAPAKAAWAWEALLVLIDGRHQLLDAARFETLETCHAADDVAAVGNWLRDRIDRGSDELIVSWQPAEAVVTNPKIFCRYWDDFCYGGSDDVIVWPRDDRWALLYHHDQIMCFGKRLTRKK